MFKRIFTNQQLSLFLQAGALMNVIGLFLDLITYHYFADNKILEIVAKNCNVVSIFLVCSVIISQTLLLFFKNHKKLFAQYPITIVSIEIILAVFCLWILTVENDIEGKFVIFYSSISRLDHSHKTIAVIIILTMLLIVDFYRNLQEPAIVNDKSVPNIVRSSLQIVVRKHLFILLFAYGIVHFKKIHKLSIAILNNSKSTLVYNLTLLEILIPVAWVGGICYYLYIKFYGKNQNNVKSS